MKFHYKNCSPHDFNNQLNNLKQKTHHEITVVPEESNVIEALEFFGTHLSCKARNALIHHRYPFYPMDLLPTLFLCKYALVTY